MSKIKYIVFMVVFSAIMVLSAKDTKAQTYVLTDGTVFDSTFYANLYPDVRGAKGLGIPDHEVLYHYIIYGSKEGRFPNAQAYAATLAAINPAAAVTGSDLVNPTSVSTQKSPAIIPIATASMVQDLKAPVDSWYLANINNSYWLYNGYGMYVGPLPIGQ